MVNFEDYASGEWAKFVPVLASRAADFGWARASLIWHRGQLGLPLHDHAFGCIHYFLKGNYFETLDSQVCVAGPGSVLVKACEQPHANLMGADLSLALRIEVKGACLRPRFSAVPSLEESCALLKLARELDDRADLETLECSTLNAVDLLQSDGLFCETSVEEDAALRLMGANPLRIGKLADEVGLHRSHLARRFRLRYGCGMRAFSLRHRANEVLQSVSFAGKSLGEAMVEAGFYDQSHGARVLGKLLGRSPSSWLEEHGRLLG